MLSVSKITAAKAKAMSRYYGLEAKSLAKELGITEEEADRRLQRDRAEYVSAQTGREIGSILSEWRDEDAAETVAESHDRTTGYYAVKANERKRLINLRGGEFEAATEEELLDMFVGRDASGQSLKDPGKLRIEKLARTANLSVTNDLPAEYYEALRAGVNPETGEELTGKAAAFQKEIYAYREPKRPENDITAIDSTFSAPKSLSLLAVTANEDLREHIIQMHVEAIEETIKFAEQELVTAKRGRGNDADYVKAEFVRAALKVELSSRARDPQLHGHCVLSSAVKGEDGRISSLDLRPWMGGSKFLGTTYRRILTAKVTKELGVAWDRDKHTGLEEMRGVSREEIEEYSKRSREIRDSLHAQAEEEAEIVSMVEKNPDQFQEARARVQADNAAGRDNELADTLTRYDGIVRDREAGQTNVKRRQKAALHSRDHKAELSEEEQLAEWEGDERLVELGERLNNMVEYRRSNPLYKDATWGEDKVALFDKFEEEFLSSSATFKEKDLRQFVMENASSRYTLDEQAELVEDFVAERSAMIRAGDKPRVGGWAIESGQPQAIFTSKEIINRQENILEAGQELDARKVHGYKPDWDYIQNIAKERGLTVEQEKILAQATSNHTLSMTNGLAGAGKTYTLQPVCNVLRNSGFTTIGLSTRASTAQALTEAGVDRHYSFEKFLMESKGGVLHDQQYERGISVDEQNLREELEHSIRSVTQQLKEGKVDTSWGEERLAGLEAEMGEWLQRRDDEKVEWGRYQELSQMVEFLPRDERHGVYEQLREIRERNPHAKITFEEDVRRRHYLVDEAGMASDRHVERLLGWIVENDPEALVTMVGDAKQMESVEVGTAFDLLASNLGATEMSRAYRPKQDWEAKLQQDWHSLDSLDEVADKQVLMAKARRLVGTYKEQGRLTNISRDAVNDAIAEGRLAPNQVQNGASILAQKQAADEFLRIRDGGESGCVLAKSHVEVAAINDLVQKELIERGEVDTAKSLDVLVSEEKGISQTVHLGDTLAIRANQNKQSLLNGQLGVVERITPRGAYISVPDEHGVKHSRFIQRDKLESEEIASLGYAQTVASSQGITVDKAVLVVDPENKHTAREDVYVGMTRAKADNSVILVSNSGSGDDSMEAALASAMVTRGRNLSPLEEMRKARSHEASDKIRRELVSEGIPVTEDEADRLLIPDGEKAAESGVASQRRELREQQTAGRVDAQRRQREKQQAQGHDRGVGHQRTRARERAMTI